MRFRIHHAAISVESVADAVEFYEKFGFRSVAGYQEPGGSMEIVHMQLGDMLLEMFWYAQRQPAPRSAADLDTDLPRVGVKHVALQVESLEDAKAFVERNDIELGTPVTEGRTGIRYFFVKDPSGNLLEIVEDNRELIRPP